jgi:uncharacterized protein (TIRG00374 family)
VSRARSVISGVLRAGIGIALLVYLGSKKEINWGSLLGLARAWPLTILALAGLLTALYIAAWRLVILMAPLGLRLGLGASLRLTLIGQFFSTFLPGGTSGDVMKIYYAAQGNEGRRMEVATIMLLDRAVGMFAMLLFPLLLTPFFPRLIGSSATLRKILWFAAMVALAMLCGFLLCLSTRVRNSRPLLWTFRNMPLGGYAERMFDALHGFSRHPSILLASTGISLMGHGVTAATVLTLAAATGGAVTSLEASLLAPIGFLANTIPLTPGGLGVGEAAFERLFRLAHITTGAEALLGWRLLTTLISLLGLFYYLQGRKRFVHAAHSTTAAEEAPVETSTRTD